MTTTVYDVSIRVHGVSRIISIVGRTATESAQNEENKNDGFKCFAVSADYRSHFDPYPTLVL